MSLLQENVYFFYGKVNKNACFCPCKVNKNVKLVIFNMSKITLVALRRFVWRSHVVNVIYVVCRRATLVVVEIFVRKSITSCLLSLVSRLSLGEVPMRFQSGSNEVPMKFLWRQGASRGQSLGCLLLTKSYDYCCHCCKR